MGRTVRRPAAVPPEERRSSGGEGAQGPPNWSIPTRGLQFFRTPDPGNRVGTLADVAQLVERNLAKVEVASSSLVVRSEKGHASDVVMGPSTGGVAERRGNGLQIRLHGFKSRLHLAVPRAIGAVVARFLDTEEVTGSNPVSPTRENRP
jgi:hypothetical protein